MSNFLEEFLKGFFKDAIPLSVIAEALGRTLSLGLVVAFSSGFLGLFLVWLVTRAEIRGARFLSQFLTVSYALPAYLLGMAWVVLGNPTVGLLKSILPEGGSYGFWGMAWVEMTVAFAFPFLELKSGFEKLDPSLEEAARMSGASPLRVFWNVSLPLLWPALLNGMSLAFLYTISSFGVPAILGLPAKKFVLTTLIYSQIKLGGGEGLLVALKLALILLIMAVMALGLSSYFLKQQSKRSGVISGSKVSRPSRIRLGVYQWPALLVAWFFGFIAVILPWGALGLSALAPVAGSYAPSDWTFRNLKYVLGLSDLREGLINSLFLTFVVTVFLVFLGFVLGFLAVRRNKNWAKATVAFLSLPFSTPGSVLALIVVLFLAWVSNQTGWMSSALTGLALAYALKYAAVPAKLMMAAYSQTHPSLEEAARISGARTLELLRTIWFPLLKTSMGAGAFLVALPIFSELTMSVLLTGPGATTLGTVLFQLQEYADQPSAAALAWLLLTTAGACAMIRAFRMKEVS